MSLKTQNQPLIVECSWDDEYVTSELERYKGFIEDTKDQVENLEPDEEAGCEDPMLTFKTRAIVV